MGLKEHEYIRQTLERYTNCPLEEFCDHVLITNFRQYLEAFRKRTKGEYHEGNFRIVNAKDLNCSMIDFGIGSPQAALIINCLAYLDNLKSVIDLETVQHATALCDWQLEVRKMHDPIDADTAMAKMEERIRRHLKKGPLKDWELKRKTGANRSGLWVYDNAIKNMKRCNEVGWDRRNRRWFIIEN